MTCLFLFSKNSPVARNSLHYRIKAYLCTAAASAVFHLRKFPVELYPGEYAAVGLWIAHCLPELFFNPTGDRRLSRIAAPPG